MADQVIVAVSGGKDSAVVLDLCHRFFVTIHPFFMYHVQGLSFQEHWLRWAENRYGVQILRVPHFDISTAIHHGAFRPEQPDVSIVKINDIYAFVRQETGAHWIAAGERISDSIVRRAMIKKSGDVDEKRGRLYPIAEWNKSHVMAYIKQRHLRVSEESTRLGFSFRSFRPKDLLSIKTYYPDDYAKILDQFPFAEASIKQMEYYG